MCLSLLLRTSTTIDTTIVVEGNQNHGRYSVRDPSFELFVVSIRVYVVIFQSILTVIKCLLFLTSNRSSLLNRF